MSIAELNERYILTLRPVIVRRGMMAGLGGRWQ